MRAPNRVHSCERRFLALLPAVLFAPAGLWAQPRVELKISASPAYVNESLPLEIVIHDFQQCEQPRIPEIAGCTVEQVGGPSDRTLPRIKQRRIQRSRTRTYHYELIPAQAGELLIPVIDVEVDGQTLKTRPRRVIVRDGHADELLSVEINSDRARIYVGQVVKLTMTVWVKPAPFGDGNLQPRAMLDYFKGSRFGPFPPSIRRIDQRTLAGPDGSQELYYTYELTTDYLAEQAGILRFDDVVIGMSYPTGFGRDFFGDAVVKRSRRLRARPKVAAIDVLPIPVENRPGSFTGAVGRYDLRVSAQPTSVRVGDPITLSIYLRGDGPVESLPAPDLSAQAALNESFRVPTETLAGRASGNHKRFTVTIRALRAGVSQIPPIEYPYFDPIEERYAVARSEPVAIRVEAARQVDTGELAELTPPTGDGPGVDLTPLDGLRGNESAESALLATVGTLRASHVLVATIAPPGVFVFSWGCIAFTRARNGDATRRRRQAAGRTARRRIDAAKNLPPPQRCAEISAALVEYLADRFDEPAAKLAGREGAVFLEGRGVDEQLLSRWTDVVERCEQSAYGGATDADSGIVAERARECLTRIERERL